MYLTFEKSTTLHYRVGNRASLFFKHQAFNRADLFAVAAVDRRSLHAVTGNQRMDDGKLPAFSIAITDQQTKRLALGANSAQVHPVSVRGQRSSCFMLVIVPPQMLHSNVYLTSW